MTKNMMIISYFSFQKLMIEKKRGVVGNKEDKGKDRSVIIQWVWTNKCILSNWINMCQRQRKILNIFYQSLLLINYSFDIRLVIKKIIIWKLLNYQ